MHENDRDQPVDAAGLYMDRVPRASFEDEVVEGLRARGALQRPARTRVFVFRAAAAVLLFLAGWGSGQLSRLTPDPEAGVESDPLVIADAAADEQFMLLLWEGPEFRPDQSLAEEYGAWGRAVAERGVPISGDELAPARYMLGPTSPGGGNTAFSGPPSEYRVGGYFMVGAGEEEAVLLAENHPHRRYGGWIEVVPVVVR